jgi:hypothetical protein
VSASPDEFLARPLVACDLDRTLIYSAAALGLGAAGAAPALRCVEIYQGQPFSFLTERAAADLARLGEVATVVPTTTRTREQYARITLPGPSARYAICANGGHLLVDGTSDPDWHRGVLDLLAGSSAPLPEVVARLAGSAPEWTLKRRIADDLFAYLVVDRAAMPAGFVTELGEWCGERGWQVSVQGRKLYCVPAVLTKSAAATEVAARAGAGVAWAAGDSLLDAELLEWADRGLRPAHGELHDLGWTRPHVTVVDAAGVLAGEELVSRLLAGCIDPGCSGSGRRSPSLDGDQSSRS